MTTVLCLLASLSSPNLADSALSRPADHLASKSGIAGTYKLDDLTLDAEMELLPLGPRFSNAYLKIVRLNGNEVHGERSIVTPNTDGTFNWLNARGNQGTTTRLANGDLESVVDTGPNKNKTTTWLKQP